jgi:hypothetical protein
VRGKINGASESVYVFVGKADNPAMMMPLPPGGEWTMEAISHNNVSGMNYETVIHKTSRRYNMLNGCKIYSSRAPMEQSASVTTKVGSI